MKGLDRLVHDIAQYRPDASLEMVGRAYAFAKRAHEGQTRSSGEPYITHPASVASIVAALKLDVASVCAALLHDTVEDTNTTVEDIENEFGKEVAGLVDGVTKLGKLPYSTREERQAENFRKMLLAMARDIRVILVKFCDRLDNMRTLHYLPAAKQERIASETLQIYAPLAHRLGIQWLKNELEDLSFRYLHPDDYDHVKREIAKSRRERERYIAEVERLIAAEMDKAQIPCRVYGRAKHLWSMWQKMRRTGRSFEDIHDAIGFRVVTDTVRSCYAALGVAHSTWTPVPGRFKDFIALPKPNMYQSLHTTVIGPKGERIEIQIRTEEMHLVAEQGIAAHWKYKEGDPAPGSSDESRFAWLRQLMESQQDLKDPTEFIESIKIDLFGDEVYVFTPRGDVKALRSGSCPIDFAYAIHSNIGDHCSGARVNGVIVPLRYQLHNGDTVEIITSPNQKPNKDWLNLVKTARARNKIRHRLRKEERDRAASLGRDLLDKSLRRYAVSLAKTVKQGELERAAKKLRCQGVDDLIYQVGYGRVTPNQVVEIVVPEEKRKNGASGSDEPPTNPFRQIFRKVAGRSSSGIQVQGESDVLVRTARCCSPLPGDQITGFITRGRGVTVHRRGCAKALDLDPDRRIQVEWDGKAMGDHEVTIQVLCADKPGLLAHISQSFTDFGVNINQAYCRAMDDGRAVNTFHARVTDLDQLKAIMRSLSRIKGVYAVDRVADSA